MIQIDHVKKHYKKFDLDCSLRVEAGQITGLIGQNGAGKSTTFKAILGLIRPESGSVSVFGKPPEEMTAKEKERIGVVLADSGFSEYFRIKDVAKVMEKFYAGFDEERFLLSCERQGLPLDKKIKEFSTGMRARLKILTATSYGAELLILDEPTAGLDVVARDEVLDLLRTYMEGGERSILISSHISSDLESLCDDIYMIHEGKVTLHENVDALLDEYGLLKADETQYEKLEKNHLLYVKKEPFGYACLTKEKQFYMENYPDIVIEKGTIDEVITMTIKGEKLW